MPVAGDDVVIATTSITVSLSASASISSLACAANLTLSSGAILTIATTASMSGTLTVNASGLRNGAWTLTGPSAKVLGVSTCDNVDFTGNFSLESGNGTPDLIFRNGMNITGTLTLVATDSRCSFEGTQTWTKGTLVGSGNNCFIARAVLAGTTLTLGPGIMITGRPLLGFTGGTVINEGSIVSAPTGFSQLLRIQPDAFINHGTVHAQSGNIEVLAPTWSGANGVIQTTSGSQLRAHGSFLSSVFDNALNNGEIRITGVCNNADHVVTFGGAGTWRLITSGSIVGGTVVMGTGKKLQVGTEGSNDIGIVDGVLLEGDIQIGSGKLRTRNGFGTTGVVTFTPTSGSPRVEFEGSQTWSAGTFVTAASGVGGTIGFPVTNGTTLTLGAGVSIMGSDTTIGTNSCTIVNKGVIRSTEIGKTTTIAASVLINEGTLGPTAGTLRVWPADSFSNSAALSVNGGTLDIATVSWASTGTISCLGGALKVDGSWTHSGPITVSGGTANLDGVWTIEGPVLCSGGTLTFLIGGWLLGPLTCSGSGTVNFNNTFYPKSVTDSPVAIQVLGGTVNIKGGVVLEEPITMTAAPGTTLSMSGVVATNGHALTIDGPSATVRLANGTIQSGSLVLVGGTLLRIPQSDGRLDGVHVEGSLRVEGSATLLRFRNGMDVSGTITTTGTNQKIVYEGTQTWSKGAIVNTSLTGTVVNVGQSTQAGSTLTIGPEVSISGGNLVIGGTLNGIVPAIVNTGVVQATSTTAGIDITLPTVLNQGQYSTTAGATLRLVGTGPSSHVGAINNGGSVIIAGTVNNASSSWALSSNGAWQLAAGAIIGGTLVIPQGQSLTTTSSSSNLLDGVVVKGDLRLQDASARLRIKNGLDLEGSIDLVGSGSRIVYDGTQTWHRGEVRTTSTLGSVRRVAEAIAPEGVLTLGSEFRINGANLTVGLSGGAVESVVNHGSIQSQAGPALTIEAEAFHNLGMVHAGPSTQLNMTSTNLVNYDALDLALNGGAWKADMGATLALPGGSTVTELRDGAALTMSGDNALITGLGQLARITPSCSLALRDGRDLAIAPVGGTLLNEGTIALESDCDLAVTGAFSQAAEAQLLLAYESESGPAIASTLGATIDGRLSLLLKNGLEPAPGSEVTLIESQGSVSGVFARFDFTAEDRSLTSATVTYQPDSIGVVIGFEEGTFIGPLGGLWFNAAHWGGGVLPGSSTAVKLDRLVRIDQLGAQAKSIVIRSGGRLLVESEPGASLSVTDGIVVEAGATLALGVHGSIDAGFVTVEAGGTLELLHPTAALEVGSLTLERGSTLKWLGGTILISGGALSAADPLTIGCSDAASLFLDGATATAPSIEVCAHGTLGGSGAVLASVSSAGLVAPGAATGVLMIDGDFVAEPSSLLEFDIVGSASGAHDLLTVTGAATIGGTLRFKSPSNDAPEAGEVATLLSATSIDGAFSGFDIPLLAPAWWRPAIDAESIRALGESLPVVAGYQVALQACVASGTTVAASADGRLAIGRTQEAVDAAGGGIVVIDTSVGIAPIVSAAIEHPTCVTFDDAGDFASIAGSVLVAGALDAIAGTVSASAPDGTTTTLDGASKSIADPRDIIVTSGGSLAIVTGGGAIQIATDPMIEWTTLATIPVAALSVVDSSDGAFGVLGDDGIIRRVNADGTLSDPAIASWRGAVALASRPGSHLDSATLYVVDDLGVLARCIPGGEPLALGAFPGSGDLAQSGDGALWFLQRGPVGAVFKLTRSSDLDGDGEVGGADLAMILGAWGTSDWIADLNGDGVVDGADIAVVLGSWT